MRGFVFYDVDTGEIAYRSPILPLAAAQGAVLLARANRQAVIEQLSCCNAAAVATSGASVMVNCAWQAQHRPAPDDAASEASSQQPSPSRGLDRSMSFLDTRASSVPRDRESGRHSHHHAAPERESQAPPRPKQNRYRMTAKGSLGRLCDDVGVQRRNVPGLPQHFLPEKIPAKRYDVLPQALHGGALATATTHRWVADLIASHPAPHPQPDISQQELEDHGVSLPDDTAAIAAAARKGWTDPPPFVGRSFVTATPPFLRSKKRQGTARSNIDGDNNGQDSAAEKGDKGMTPLEIAAALDPTLHIRWRVVPPLGVLAILDTAPPYLYDSDDDNASDVDANDATAPPAPNCVSRDDGVPSNAAGPSYPEPAASTWTDADDLSKAPDAEAAEGGSATAPMDPSLVAEEMDPKVSQEARQAEQRRQRKERLAAKELWYGVREPSDTTSLARHCLSMLLSILADGLGKDGRPPTPDVVRGHIDIVHGACEIVAPTGRVMVLIDTPDAKSLFKDFRKRAASGND